MKYLFLLPSIIFLTLCQSVAGQAGSLAGDKSFGKRYENTIKGNLKIVANSIITKSDNPNENYNGNGNNNSFGSAYIDIDGDVSTFSSSSADYVNGATCSNVVYAGLYWSATYPLNGNPAANAYPAIDNRPDFRAIKFKVPGRNYVDINSTTAPYTTEVVYNGYRNTATNPTNNTNKDVPYVCYADVTSLVSTLADPTGTYTIGNVRGYVGNSREGGTTGGWILVIVHEDPLDTTKYVVSYDGFTSVTGTTTTDYQVDGFITVPNGPVKAEYSIGALEGDLGIVNDNLNIRADRNTVFTRLSNAGNPGANFFNSSITVNGNNVTTRVPNSRNTLGFDADNFLIPNALNLVVPNDEIGATFRVQTTGDAYSVFMNTFSIEIIAPDLFVTKRVYNTSNSDITGGDVTLGQEIFYELEVQNIGNDNAVNAYIIDDLPLNVNYLPGFIEAPDGITVSYNATTRQVRFDIDNSLLEVNDAAFKIRFKARIVENCFELRDACSNIIENTAASYYQGFLNPQLIENEPSFYAIDACNTGIAGSSNFLINTDDCDFTRTELLCGSSLEITAGNGYDSYTWTDQNGNVVGNTQTITVTSPGRYSVFKEALQPCVDDTETVIVDFFSTITNPLVSQADNVRTCGIDGSLLPEFFLCGANDSKLINLQLQDASRISWQKRDPNSCPVTADLDCPNTNAGCVWNEVATGPDYLIESGGNYRIRLDFTNGCFRTFFFNVYQNTIDPDIRVIEPIVCGNPGSIEVLDVPSSGYEFSLSPAGPFQSSPVFAGLTVARNYTVFIRQSNGLSGACVFQESIDLPEFRFNARIVKRDILCKDDKGQITVQITNGQPNYEYRITNTSGLDLRFNTVQSTYTFTNLDAGNYQVEATGSNGVCLFTQSVEIVKVPDLTNSATVIKHIDCSDGLIRLSSGGGTADYQYAVYSYNGNIIDAVDYQFQSTTDFTFVTGEEGLYVFIVVDQNNCTALTAPVGLRLEPAVTYTVTEIDPQCSEESNGSIQINITTSGTGNLSYSIDGGTSFQSSTAFNGLMAGTYDVVVRSTNLGNSCDVESQVILNEPTAIAADITLLRDLGCTDNARIEVGNITGGTAPYQYSIDGITFSTVTVFDVSASGDYSITVRDANNCTFQTEEVVVSPVQEITDLSFTQTALTCPTLVTDVVVGVSGGAAPFTYEIIAPSSSVLDNGSNETFSNLAAGTYTIRVTDSKNCTFEESVTINAVDPINVTGQRLSNAVCVGDNGSFRFIVNGFSSSYDYAVTGPATFSDVAQTNGTINLTGPAGTYEITVTDNTTNCTDTATIVIQEPAASLTVDNLILTQLSCSPSGNVAGSVRIQTTGGWGSNRYSLTRPDGSTAGPQGSRTFTGLLQEGIYIVSVTDLNGCVVSDSFEITPIVQPELSLSLLDVCYDPTTQGTIIATIAAGTGIGPFRYQLNAGASQSSNTFSNLLPGTYMVTVADSKNCTDVETVTIHPELLASARLIKGLDCSATPAASIELLFSGGTNSYTYEISTDNGASFSSYTGSFPYITTTAGSFRFRVSDANSICQVETPDIIVEPITNPRITSLDPVASLLCNGDVNGSFFINLDSTQGSSPYQITVNGTSYGTQRTITGLAAGIYNVVVTDSKGCSDTASITITQPDAVMADVTETPLECNSSSNTLGTIIIGNVTGGTATPSGYTYTITNNFGFTDSYTAAAGEDYTFIDLNFGIYDVVIEDSNGCNYMERVTIASPPITLDIDVTAIAADCTNGAAVVVTVGATVGGSNYSFAVLVNNNPTDPANIYQPSDAGFSDQSTFTNLLPGIIYTFIVRDNDSGCYYIEQAASTTATYSSMTASIDEVEASCVGSDGSVSFTFNNYDPGATRVDYEIYDADSNLPTGITGNSNVNPPTGALNDRLGPLTPGRYFILFTEVGGANAGCESTSAIFEIVDSPRPLELTASSTDDNCNVNAGVITASPRYGTAPYTFIYLASSDPAPIASDTRWTSNTTANVEDGLYAVYVRDGLGCIVSAPVTVLLDPSPEVTLRLINACVAEGNYQVEVTLTATGIAPYQLSVDGGAPVTVGSFPFTVDNLTSGNHSFELSDSNGCADTTTINVDPPLIPAASIVAQPTCTGADGVIEVQATGGSGSYSYELLDSSSGPTGFVINASNQFTGLPFGDYTVRTIDTGTTPNCIVDRPISLEEPENIELLAPTISNISCNGGMDGDIIVNLDPATPTSAIISYELLDIANNLIAGPQPSGLFTGLAAGNYSVRVTAGANCNAMQGVVITEPSALAITASATTFACAPNNTINVAQINVAIDNDVSGAPSGTGPYLYSINGINFQTENTFDIVDNGAVQNITVTTVDANGCSATDAVVIQPLPAIIDVSISQDVDLTCSSPEEVTVTITGGSGNFTYQQLPSGIPISSTNRTQTFTLSAPGDYTFRVTDNDTGCFFTALPYTVNPVIDPSVGITRVSEISCLGAADASIDIDVQDYTGAYSYEVRNLSGTTVAIGTGNTATNPERVTNLGAGRYTVFITESGTPFCSDQSNVVLIQEPSALLSLSLLVTNDLTCVPGNDGSITATALNGWGDYSYSLEGGPFTSQRTFTGLSAGTYTVRVRDRATNYCEVTETATISAPIALTASINATSLVCNNDATATIGVSAGGGQGAGSYFYQLNYPDGSTSARQLGSSFTNIPAGIYTVTVSDDLNCEVISNPVTIVNPPEVRAQARILQAASCLIDGSIVIDAINGQAPYQYSRDGINFVNTNTFNNLPAGTYRFYVRDANDCISPVSNGITIEPIVPLTGVQDLRSAFINCAGESDANIIITARGGLGNYRYQLFDSTNTSIAGPQTQNSFRNIGAGTYYTIITSADCTFRLPDFTVTDPDPIAATVSSSNITCFGEMDGRIVINATGGTGELIYSIDQLRYDTVNEFNNLPAGNYTVFVQDENGCYLEIPVVITEPGELDATSTIISQNICPDDANNNFEVVIQGGTGPFEVSLDNVNFITITSNTYTFEDLDYTSSYPVFIRDANGCQTIVEPVTFDPPNMVDAFFELEYDCNGGNILTIQGIDPATIDNYLFSLDGLPGQLSPEFINVAEGVHSIDIQDTVNGCMFTISNVLVEYFEPMSGLTAIEIGLNSYQLSWNGGTPEFLLTLNGARMDSDIFTISADGEYDVIVTDSRDCQVNLKIQLEFIDIDIPNFFTPDGNGENDLWSPDNIEQFPTAVIIIFDRYGRVLRQYKGTDQGWDGIYQDKLLPSGDYWYAIELNDEEGRVFKGHFTLYR